MRNRQSVTWIAGYARAIGCVAPPTAQAAPARRGQGLAIATSMCGGTISVRVIANRPARKLIQLRAIFLTDLSGRRHYRRPDYREFTPLRLAA